MAESVENLRQKLAKYNQEHLLDFWDTLDAFQKEEFYKELIQLDIPKLTKDFQRATQMQLSTTNEKLDSRMKPIPDENFGSTAYSTKDELWSFRDTGLRCIAEDKVGVLLLAGGQGTRLGVNYPKGMYDVGLPSQKTLFQIQAERLLRVKQLATSMKLNSTSESKIPWYIMTSEGTKHPTIEYLQKNEYFGLHKDDVIVFEQGSLPAFSFDGKIILEGPCKISKAPDGNGGLYKALRDQGILEDMKSRGIEYIHVYCVDNILVKVVDPVFIGYCLNKSSDCGAKVVEKTNPTESVGVFCKVDGIFQVVEYSEITSATAEKRNSKTDRLEFNAGNICNHFFTTAFLEKLCSGLNDSLIHHIAKKKIPYINKSGILVQPKEPNGIKLEKFVFDVFRFSENLAVWQVLREEEFSPLKNTDTENKDTPTTCRNDLMNLHVQYLIQAGVKLDNFSNSMYNIPDDNNNRKIVVEISPLVSYDGENLEYISNNIKVDLQSPLYIVSNEESIPNSIENTFKIIKIDCDGDSKSKL